MESPVQCGCNAHTAPGFFIWQELPLKHPKRMRKDLPRCRRQRSMGIGEFPQQAENRFRVTKALLAEEFDSLTKRLIDAKIKEKIAGGLLNELGGNN